MMGKSLIRILSILLFFSFLHAEEPFRVFKTPSGKTFEGKVVGYEGQIFILTNKSGQLFQVPFNALSTPDKTYLVEAVRANRIPKGRPAPKPVSSSTVDSNAVSKGVTSATVKAEDPTSKGEKKDEDVKIHRAPPKKKITFRPGSFFAHVVVPLGVSPDEALAKIQGSKPKPGEPIDFDLHVLPILEQSCNRCHHAPFDRSGRLVNPKASLRFDSYAQVMKGNLDGPVIVANDLEKSRLYTVLNLPEDDDLFMPPKGGPMDSEQKDVIKRWIEEGAKPSKNIVSATKGGVPTADEPVSFNDHILPLFEKRCLNCHGETYVKNGRTIKPTAGLQLNTYEMVLKGNLDGTIVTPGDPTVSTLYQVVILPDDDPELMPPKGDPLTEEERTMIKRWILEGASEQPAAVAADPNAEPKPKVENELVAGSSVREVSPLEIIARGLPIPGKSQLKSAGDQSQALVTQLSERNPLVRAEFSSFAGEINDSNLAPLGSIKNNISHFDVSRTKVTDKAIDAAGSMQRLYWFSARRTMVSDKSLNSLSKLKHLSYLNLSETQVTDRGLRSIAAIKSLKEIYLWGSKVTDDGAAFLQKELPDAKIVY